MLSTARRAKLRKKIGAEISATEEAAREPESKAQPVDSTLTIGRLDRAEVLNRQELARTALQQKQNQLAQLKSALGRVDDEDFGICEECATEIPPQRLLAVPESTVCVKCKEQQEARARRMR